MNWASSARGRGHSPPRARVPARATVRHMEICPGWTNPAPSRTERPVNAEPRPQAVSALGSQREPALLGDTPHPVEVEAAPRHRAAEAARQVRPALAPIQTLAGERSALAARPAHIHAQPPEAALAG